MKLRLVLLIFLILAGGWRPAFAQYLGSGTITAAGTTCTPTTCVSVGLFQDTGAVSFTISGTWSATLQFEVSEDNTHFVALNAYPPNSTTAVTNTAANGTWTAGVAGMVQFRVRASAYSSGTATVSIQGSKAVALSSLTGGGGGGGSGVSSFSGDGTLLSNSASTGAVTATLENAGADTVWGNNTGSNAAPGYFSDLSFGMPQFASYTISTNGTTVSARNNSTGAIDYSSTDAAVAINDVLTNNDTTCGTVYFKNGDYLLKSATLETTGGYTGLYYSIGIPANAGSANQYCEWRFVGEGIGATTTSTVQTAGVIFDYTSTALTACGSTPDFCVAWWHRPDTTNHEGNDVYFQNISTRFPTNTRGDECAFCMWEAATVNYDHDSAWLDEALTGIPAATPGTLHMVGMTSTMSERNNWEHFRDTWVGGYDIAYDIESEHTLMDAATAIQNNYFGYYGRTATYGSFTTGVGGYSVFHPSIFKKITDQDNINGLVLGPTLAQGSLLNIDGYDIQTTTGTFARSTNLTETNQGFSGGTISYTNVAAGTGITNNASLWSAGGYGFTMRQGLSSSTFQQPITQDTFHHPNASGATALGPAWSSVSSGVFTATLSIVNDTATSSLAATPAASIYNAQTFNSDQFSQFTVSACDTQNLQVYVRASAPTALNGYAYAYGTSSQHFLEKYTAGTRSLFTSTAATTDCSPGDIIELDAVGSTLLAYRTRSGVKTLDMTAVDTSFTTGSPGVGSNSNQGLDAFTNFVGGNLPTATGTDSIYNRQGIFPSIGTLTGCASSASPAVCGSAAAGFFTIAAAAGTVTVNTTAVTANSVIGVAEDFSLGTALSVTCNTATAPGFSAVTARTPGVSFTFAVTNAPSVNPDCFSYFIIN